MEVSPRGSCQEEEGVTGEVIVIGGQRHVLHPRGHEVCAAGPGEKVAKQWPTVAGNQPWQEDWVIQLNVHLPASQIVSINNNCLGHVAAIRRRMDADGWVSLMDVDVDVAVDVDVVWWLCTARHGDRIEGQVQGVTPRNSRTTNHSGDNLLEQLISPLIAISSPALNCSLPAVPRHVAFN